jgi:hypothetical protein
MEYADGCLFCFIITLCQAELYHLFTVLAQCHWFSSLIPRQVGIQSLASSILATVLN